MPITGQTIANVASSYLGSGYAYGGPCSTANNCDCSSFVSRVLGLNCGLPLPGGGKWGSPAYPPNAHGPVVTDYASWNGATTVSTASPGVLAVFVGTGASGHIGVCVSDSEMVSALNSTVGVVQTPIVGYGPAGSPLIYRKVNAALLAVGLPATSGGLASSNPLLGILTAGALVLGVWGLVLVGATAAGLALAAGVAWAGRQVVSE
jgi:hypothetical protein